MEGIKRGVFNDIRITNMTMSGKLPFRRRLRESEIEKLVDIGFILANEEISPVLQLRFEKDGTTHRKTKKCACVTIWASGAVNIVGITSEEEGFNYYNRVLGLLQKEIKKAFQETL